MFPHFQVFLTVMHNYASMCDFENVRFIFLHCPKPLVRPNYESVTEHLHYAIFSFRYKSTALLLVLASSLGK